MSNVPAQIDVDQSRAVAERLLGRRPDRCEPFQPAVPGDDSHGFRLWVGADAMLLKIKKRPGSPVGVYFHGRLEDASVPVPKLIAFDVGCRIMAVVDYVEAMAGGPRWELAWFDYCFSQFPYNDERFDLARFRAAYGADHDPDDAVGRFYLAAVLLFAKLLFFKLGDLRTVWAVQTLEDILASFSGSEPLQYNA